MHPARRALITLLLAVTALAAQAGGGAAAPSLPAPARECVLSAAWKRSMASNSAWSQPRDETDAQTEDVMIVIESSLAGLY